MAQTDSTDDRAEPGRLPASARPSSLLRVARLTRKELSEILRDRRTIITLIAMPLLLYPVMSVAFQQFFLASRVSAKGPQEIRLGFANEEEARLFVTRLGIGETALQQRQEAKGAKSPGATKLQTYQLEPEKFEEKLREGQIDLAIRVPKARDIASTNEQIKEGRPEFMMQGRDWAFGAEVTFVSNAAGALGALAYVERRLAAADEADLLRRLNAPGPAPRTVVIGLKRTPLEAAGTDTLVSLSSLVPLILILMTITGAVYPAIDLTAGERERGTLEMLMAAPVPRFELLTAKYFSVLAVAVLTALVNLTGMALTLQLSGLSRVILPESGLTPLLLLQLFALLLLFAAFFSAVLLSLTSFARSFKEAQAYLIPLMLVSLAPGVLAMMPGIKLSALLAVVPLLNVVLLARDLFDGTAELGLALLVVTTTLFYALAALSLAARVFGSESVLYSEQSGWSDLLRRAEEPSAVGSIPAALWCLAVAVPLHFVLVGLLQQLALPTAALMLVIGVASVLQFVGLPALAAWLGRVRWTSGFGLTAPRPAALLAGLLLGVSLWPLLLQLLEFVTAVREEHEDMLAALRSRQQGLELLLLATTVIAAIAEELFFRGFLFAALRARTNAWITIGATALLFGLTHVFLGGALGVERLLPSMLLGLILGGICWMTGSVWPGLLLHVCHNTLLVLFGQTEWARANQIPPAILMAGAVGTLAGGAFLLLWGRRDSLEASHTSATA